MIKKRKKIHLADSAVHNFPGLHSLITLAVENSRLLIDCDHFLNFSEIIIDKYELERVGVSAHIFENQSYTAAICLKESHICIHTWPEFKQLTLDVYLCNYLQDNTDKVRNITKDYIAFFEATVVKQFQIER